MLSPYKYINHNMEKVQKFVDYIFFDVWMKSRPKKEYSFRLYFNREYKKIIKDLYVSDSETSTEFCTLVEEIFYIISKLDKIKKVKLYKYYQRNLNIQKLCEDKEKIPISYEILESLDITLSKKIRRFYDLLYGSNSILTLKEILKISSFKEHYKEFIKINKNRCLFCGLEKLETVENYRSDYDHFLPKAKYPFLSINLKNLAPTCDKCNRKYKLSTDPLYKKDNTTRRKAIYPYSTNQYDFNINIQLVNMEDTKGEIEPENVKIGLQVKSNEERDTWDSLYNITNRYKNVCSFKDEARNWLNMAKNVMDEDSITLDEYIAFEKKRYRSSPWYHEIVFLKIPFLEACAEKGLLS